MDDFWEVYDIIEQGVYQYAAYPKDLKEAKDFVSKYKQFSIDL